MMRVIWGLLWVGSMEAGLAARAVAQQADDRFKDTLSIDRPQFPSTYRRRANPAVLIRNATVMTATGSELKGASILLQDGKIVAVGDVRTRRLVPSPSMGPESS